MDCGCGDASHPRRRSITARVTRGSIEETGASLCTQDLPPKYCVKIFSAVRVASAWVVKVGFGPPIPFARAELSTMNRRLTHLASELLSSTESFGLDPIRIV